MDLSSVVRTFAVPVTLTRQAPGVYDPHGRWVAGVSMQLSRRMAVVPATSRDLQVLPEGLRTEEARIFFDTEELRGAVAGVNGTAADRVAYNGSTYELQHIEDWNDQGAFWKAIGTKVEQ